MNVELTMKNLSKNGIDACLVKNKEEALEKVKSYLQKGDKVAMGGSLTLSECGVVELLQSKEYNFIDRKTSAIEESYSADVYFSSCNAITENGELYNVDGNSNRISAIAHGPKSVVMVVSTNKIVKDLDDAIYRVKTICAPLNTKRLNCDTYCNKNGKCASLLKEHSFMTDGCDSPSRICCNYLVSAKQRHIGRIKVILVDEKLGY